MNASPRQINAPSVDGVCSKCSAAVSGFPGDYAKCSKCGQMEMLRSDPPAGWRLVARPQRLAQLPLWIVPLFYASIGAILWTGGGTDISSSAFVVIVFAGWIFSIMQFSKSAESQPRWWVPVLEYHAVALLMIPCFMWLAGGVQKIATWTVDWMSMAWLVFAAVLSFICLLLYGDARRRIAHLTIVRR